MFVQPHKEEEEEKVRRLDNPMDLKSLMYYFREREREKNDYRMLVTNTVVTSLFSGFSKHSRVRKHKRERMKAWK